jgi:hypothetical protein
MRNAAQDIVDRVSELRRAMETTPQPNRVLASTEARERDLWLRRKLRFGGSFSFLLDLLGGRRDLTSTSSIRASYTLSSGRRFARPAGRSAACSGGGEEAPHRTRLIGQSQLPSLLRQPRLAEAVEHRREIRLNSSSPLPPASLPSAGRRRSGRSPQPRASAGTRCARMRTDAPLAAGFGNYCQRILSAQRDYVAWRDTVVRQGQRFDLNQRLGCLTHGGD